MDFSILDVGGNFLGPALGLRALGHRVRYWTNGRDASVRRLAAGFGDGDEPCFDGDLVVYSASFGDEHQCLELGLQLDHDWRPDAPLQPSVNPLQARAREAWLNPRLPGPERLVLVDMGDADLLAPAFTGRGGRRFKRELRRDLPAVDVTPFPFLYFPALLELEAAGRLDALLCDPAARGTRSGALFAGTVDHWRYEGRRRRLLDELARRHPDLPLRVATDLSLADTWRQLQEHRCGVSLPGRGELCFRHHELGALGVPTLAARGFGIQVPEAWELAFPTRLAELRSPEDMRWFYLRHYHPIRAATALLEAIGVSRDAVPTGAPA